MGRLSGYLAVQAGIITGAELVLIPEIKTPPREVARAIEEAYRRGKTHAIVVVAEGFKPPASELGAMIDAMDIGFTTRVTILGHVQRGGKPTGFDRMLATRFGVKAVQFLLEGKSGVMTALSGREIIPIPIDEVINNKKVISQDYIEMARMLAR
jgi:6-phosphofructokinase 1